MFKKAPIYVTKSNKKGKFVFSNLKNKNYQVFALTGSNFIYEKGEEIAFFQQSINMEIDSFIILNLFNPVIDSNHLEISSSSAALEKNDKEMEGGSLLIESDLKGPLIFQLIKNEKILLDSWVEKSPYLVTKIPPGKYKLKCILDKNGDGKWNTGNFDTKKQPEKVINYKEEIFIRSNWDLLIEWGSATKSK